VHGKGAETHPSHGKSRGDNRGQEWTPREGILLMHGERMLRTTEETGERKCAGKKREVQTAMDHTASKQGPSNIFSKQKMRVVHRRASSLQVLQDQAKCILALRKDEVKHTCHRGSRMKHKQSSYGDNGHALTFLDTLPLLRSFEFWM